MSLRNTNEEEIWKDIDMDIRLLRNHMECQIKYVDPTEVIAYVHASMATVYRHIGKELIDVQRK